MTNIMPIYIRLNIRVIPPITKHNRSNGNTPMRSTNVNNNNSTNTKNFNKPSNIIY